MSKACGRVNDMTINPVLNAIENLGGTATIAQVSSATALKRAVARDELTKLVGSNLLDHLGGSVYRVKPERLTAASEAPSVETERAAARKAAAVAAEKVERKRRVGERGPDRKRRKSPVGDKVIEALKALDGEATTAEIAQVAGLTTTQVADSCYKLRKHGEISSPKIGHYVLVGYTAPEAAQTPAEEVPAPEVPEAVETPLEASPEASETITITDPHADTRLIADALATLLPNGMPLNAKGLRACAKFVDAAEKVLALGRS